MVGTYNLTSNAFLPRGHAMALDFGEAFAMSSEVTILDDREAHAVAGIFSARQQPYPHDRCTFVTWIRLSLLLSEPVEELKHGNKGHHLEQELWGLAVAHPSAKLC